MSEFLCDPDIYDTTSSINRLIKDLTACYNGRNRVLNVSVGKILCNYEYYNSRWK